MKAVAPMTVLSVAGILSCARAEASYPPDASQGRTGIVLVGPGETIRAYSPNACPGEPDRKKGCGYPLPDLRKCRDGKGQCVLRVEDGYSVRLEVPVPRSGVPTWASACWELVPQDATAFNELEIDIRSVAIPGEVHFKLEKFAMGSGGEVLAAVRAPGKIILDADNFRSPQGATVLSGPERFCVVLLPNAGDTRAREVAFTIGSVALRSNVDRPADELVLVGDRGRVVDYSYSQCEPCRDNRGRACAPQSSSKIALADSGAWSLDLTSQPRRKSQRSWASGCWELNPVKAAEARRFRELAVEVGPVATPGEVLFKLEPKGPVAGSPAPVCPPPSKLPGREVLEWVGAPMDSDKTRTVILDLDNFTGDDSAPDIARLCAVLSPPEDGPATESRAVFDIRRAVFRGTSAQGPQTIADRPAPRRKLVLIGEGGRMKSYSFSTSRGATASATRIEDAWDLDITAPDRPGSYSGVCWDLNPLAVDSSKFNNVVIEVRNVNRRGSVHIKMERPNWRQQQYGLMILPVRAPGELHLSLAGFARALDRLGRFCVQSLPSSGSDPHAAFTMGRVYLSN